MTRILDPNRKKYEKEYRSIGECIFCGDDEVLVCEGVENEGWRVIVNQFPYMDGNVMLVPKRHVEDTDKVTADEWQQFGELLADIKNILGKVFGTKSFNIALHIGPESGASIPHLHWQLLPRKFKNVTAVNTFADLHVVAVTPKETQELIQEAFAKEIHSSKTKR